MIADDQWFLLFMRFCFQYFVTVVLINSSSVCFIFILFPDFWSINLQRLFQNTEDLISRCWWGVFTQLKDVFNHICFKIQLMLEFWADTDIQIQHKKITYLKEW